MERERAQCVCTTHLARAAKVCDCAEWHSSVLCESVHSTHELKAMQPHLRRRSRLDISKLHETEVAVLCKAGSHHAVAADTGLYSCSCTVAVSVTQWEPSYP